MVHGQKTNSGNNFYVRPPLQVPMFAPGTQPEASKGGMGYGLHMRQATVGMMVDAENNGRNRSTIFSENADYVPSRRTQRRWYRQNEVEGTTIPKRHTGNKPSERQILGLPLLLLAVYRSLFPKAERCEIQAFLYRAYSASLPQPFFFSLTAITNAESELLGLNWKKGSTTAHQAFTPINQSRRWCYWNLDAPHGIADVARDDMIDIDEAGIFLEKANRRYGKAHVSSRTRAAGNYGHGEKHTLLLAIAGGPDGERWIDYSSRAGTSAYDFYQFIEKILVEIGHANLSRK